MKKPKLDWRRFAAILKKEFIQIKRDPISLRLPIIMPIMMMLLFGYAVTTEVSHIPTAVLDLSHTQESREYVDAFRSSQYFVVAQNVGSQQELSNMMDAGVVKAALTIPPDFAADRKAGRNPQCEFVIDGSDPTTARTALNSGLLVGEMYSLNLRQAFLKKTGQNVAALPGVTLNTRVWYNPSLQSTRFSIPGLVGLILQNITLMLTVFSLVREKERGTIEQLIVTPIRSLELILGKLVPYVLIGYAGFLFALAICVFWFGVYPAGSIALLLVLGLLFVLCTLMMGMLISTFAKNQLQAMMVMIMILLPSILLSGFMFPRDAMPPVIREIGLLFPITYFLNIVRGIIVKGVGTDVLWKDIAAMAVFFFVLLFATIKRFKKSLD